MSLHIHEYLNRQSDFAKSILKRYVIPAQHVPNHSSSSLTDLDENVEKQKMIRCFKETPRHDLITDLLSKHDTGFNAFITHLDRSPIPTKITAFLITSIVLAPFIAWVLWRVQASPYYFVSGDFEVPKLKSGVAWYWKPFHLAIDSFTWKYIWPPVQRFLTGELLFRLRFGFRTVEIIFREPKGWIRLKNLPEDLKYQACWENFHRALSPSEVYHTTGSGSSLRGFWSLNYSATLDAHRCIEKGDIRPKTWDFSVWMSDGTDWFVWRLWRAYDMDMIRKGTVMFQNRLKELGKASLFEQWQMMKESDPGTTPLSGKPIFLIEDLFRRHGLDYFNIWFEILQTSTRQIALTVPITISTLTLISVQHKNGVTLPFPYSGIQLHLF